MQPKSLNTRYPNTREVHLWKETEYWVLAVETWHATDLGHEDYRKVTVEARSKAVLLLLLQVLTAV